jgi:2-polyprenyl-6-hydroxyphenyl methylase/3-demethylubiquinone-9 3-methyltransferase
MVDKAPNTFSFGENWQDFLRSMPDDALDRARQDSAEWIDDGAIAGRSVIDIGCGSGLHSLVFHVRGATRVRSIDVDQRSVQATQELRTRSGSPISWIVETASILDPAPPETETYDIVYSWGVLHHTGAMWEAMEHACRLVRPGGLFWFSLYAKGPHYQRDLALKHRYNASGRFEKWWLVKRAIFLVMLHRLRIGKNPLSWNAKKARGMDTFHDLIDWLGGLPYEVASIEEVSAFMKERRFQPLRIAPAPEGSCHIFLFQNRP